MPPFFGKDSDVALRSSHAPEGDLLKALRKEWLDRKIELWRRKLEEMREELDEATSDREKLKD